MKLVSKLFSRGGAFKHVLLLSEKEINHLSVSAAGVRSILTYGRRKSRFPSIVKLLEDGSHHHLTRGDGIPLLQMKKLRLRILKTYLSVAHIS